MGVLRYPHRPPEQHPRRHHQRHRSHCRGHLPLHLLPLLPQQEAPEDVGCAGRGVGVHAGGDSGRASERAHAQEAFHDRRHPLRLLRLHHVLLPAHHHGESDKDEERRVHAVLPVAGVLPQRRLLDGLRAHPLRHLCDHPQRPRCHLRCHPAHPLRLLLPDHTQEDQGRQGRRDALRHLRSRCRRHRQWRQCRLRHLVTTHHPPAELISHPSHLFSSAAPRKN
uniref:Uncharacterized protein n=1 Tax=Oryza rufipogon TaxID=4529 RepID=A0A0E0MZ13_ORYRU